MKRNIIKTSIYVIASLILLSAVFGAGAYVGYNNRPEIDKVFSVINKNPQSGITTAVDFNSFWKVWNLINEKSIYAGSTTDQDRVWGAISGLVSSLGDPYSVFFPPEENKAFNDEIRGSFGGIGAEIGMKDKVLTIIAPLKDTPAWNSGIKKGDKILKIDNTDASSMTIDKAISLIRGPVGTVVTLTIVRPNENATRDFKITRANIDIPTIDTEVLKDNIFVIKFYSFSLNSDNMFKDALIKFANSGSHKLIIDLRGNPGGYLDSAVNIGSWFIDEGKVIVSEDFGGNRKPEVYRSHGPRLFNDNLKLIVLVDGGSASASEILAGALQEHGIGTLVGEQTFGKGSVQELLNITDTTSLKVTVAKWLTPNGTSISLHGLTPDVKVSITDKDIAAHRDPQMDKAVEILTANP
ncbi:MAG TPA: S41 family peptidase [Candidatus Paceibacterota bacterium]|nr:S41 family peptidase [Candidatus Paceibacterota bacterium]